MRVECVKGVLLSHKVSSPSEFPMSCCLLVRAKCCCYSVEFACNILWVVALGYMLYRQVQNDRGDDDSYSFIFQDLFLFSSFLPLRMECDPMFLYNYWSSGQVLSLLLVCKNNLEPPCIEVNMILSNKYKDTTLTGIAKNWLLQKHLLRYA